MRTAVKVAVGISGGVDSAVAALRLLEAGYEVVGVTMTLGRADEEKSLAEARAVAGRLGLPLHVFDCASDWSANVLKYVRDTYLAGETPNPCVRCNSCVKFGLLPRWAFETLGCDLFATGHYARLKPDDCGGNRLFRGMDRSKDQSYFLYRVAPEILARTLFPLGEMTKAEVRAVARENGFAVAEKGDSQDFCGGDPMAIVAASPREGNIVTAEGMALGRHSGYWHFTPGQRRGLGIGGGTPYYVTELRPRTNEVVVGFKNQAVRTTLRLRDTVGRIDLSLPVKVRSGGEPHLLRDGILGIAPGQSAVFYDGDEVVGGGIILSPLVADLCYNSQKSWPSSNSQKRN